MENTERRMRGRVDSSAPWCSHFSRSDALGLPHPSPRGIICVFRSLCSSVLQDAS